MNILITGASGFIGTHLTLALHAAGHRVQVASRRTGVDFSTMCTSADWQAHLCGVDAVVNCVGIIGETGRQRFVPLHTTAPCALFDACRAAGVRRVVQISALGADDTAFSAYHLSKRAADEHLKRLDLDWFVLRPSLIYGHGGTSAALFMRLAALPVIPVIGSGEQRLQPVHIGDVVAVVVHCLSAPDARQTLDIVGPETVSFAQWLQAMRAALGKEPAPLLHVPFGLAMACARLFGWVFPLLQVDNLRMLRAGYHADPQPIARFLGRPLRQAEPRLFFADAVSVGRTS